MLLLTAPALACTGPALAAEPPSRTNQASSSSATRTTSSRKARPHHARGRRRQITVTKKTRVTSSTCSDHRRQQSARSCSRARRAVRVRAADGTQFNLSYRGLGNPQESEYVLVLQDGIPTRRLDRLPDAVLHAAAADARRGGADPRRQQPAVRARSRRRRSTSFRGARRRRAVRRPHREVVGSHGLFSSYNTVEGVERPVRRPRQPGTSGNDGERDNGRSRDRQGDGYLGVPADNDSRWSSTCTHHDASSGDPGQAQLSAIRRRPEPVADAVQPRLGAAHA